MKKPDTSSLTDQVYSILWQEIVQRTLKPNQKLDINEIASQMDVSRTPVMDALSKLEADGLVLRRNRVGTFVTALNKSAFLASFQSREMVEQYITPLAITNLTPEKVQQLRDLLVASETLLSGVDDQTFNYGAYTRYDHDFHLILVKLCNNTQIIDYYRSLNSHMQIARAYARQALKRATEGLDEHQQILDAFIDGDVARARKLQQTHLERSRDGVLKIIEEHEYL